MFKIEIEWNFCSPFLQICTGVLTIFEHKDYNYTKKILECNITRQPGSTGFSATDKNIGYDGIIFKKFEEEIKRMVDAYYDGMMVEKNMYSWIIEKGDL